MHIALMLKKGETGYRSDGIPGHWNMQKKQVSGPSHIDFKRQDACNSSSIQTVRIGGKHEISQMQV